MVRPIAAFALVAWLAAAPAQGQQTTQGSVYWDELTWTEIGDAITSGKTTAIIPTGAIEDKGPHMAVNQHSVTVRYAAGEIARRLGNALVAPLISYAPNGEIAPMPTGHMRMMGSLTLPQDVYSQFVEWAARSLHFQGMRTIAIIWDSGGNAAGIKAAADRLNKEWAGTGSRVYPIDAYYLSTNADFEPWLREQGETLEAIGQQGGITQTSEVLAVDPSLLRRDKFAMGGPREMEGSGVTGDPRRATALYGKQSIDMKVDAAITQLKTLTAAK